MRSEIAKKILASTPKDVDIFVRLYGDIVVRIHEILKAKGISQKDLAEGMDKKQSEISKWLNGEHNFTLRSLSKLSAELGETLIEVPQSNGYKAVRKSSTKLIVHVNKFKRQSNTVFNKAQIDNSETAPKIA
jgi:transcriptional regulator with XRE-family HTH domain